MKDNKYEKLAKNTVIFAIGNFSTKVLSFLIVPLYTYVLTTAEYGKIDLFTTSVGFFTPLITLTIEEAIIRFLLGKEISEQEAVSNSLVVFLIGTIISCALFPLYRWYFGDYRISVMFLLVVVTTSFNAIYTQFLRASGKNVIYTIKGVVGTSVLLLLNLLFLVIFKLGMMGYLYSTVCAQVVGIIYLMSIGGLWDKLHLKYYNKNTLLKMIKYSIPMIPNSLMWWIMAAGDKYIINYYLGDSANGIYSLSLKIPTIISMMYSIFFQAWQMAAIEEDSSSDKDKFYEKIYKLTNAFLIIVVSGVILIIRPLYSCVLNNAFASAWNYVPIIAIATAVNCQASFFGVVYTTTKKTKKAFFTTLVGAICNLMFNFLLIKPFGLQGVAIGTLMGYIAVLLMRMNDARTEIKMSFDLRRTVVLLGLLILQSFITLTTEYVTATIVGLIVLIIGFTMYKKEATDVLNKLMIKIKNKKG